MAVAVVMKFKGATLAQYDNVVEPCTSSARARALRGASSTGSR